MASTLGRVPDHELSTLLLNRPAPIMPPAIVNRNPPPGNIIEISDDEDDPHHHRRHNPAHPDLPVQTLPLRGFNAPLAFSMNTRLNPDTSPTAPRDTKRQKLDNPPEASGSRMQYPRACLKFADTDEGSVAYPSFWNDDFIPDLDPEAESFILQDATASQVRQPPYYFDAKLNIRMYCGPGYEVFPLPVEHDPSFQDACNAFDAREWEDVDEVVHNDLPITAVQQNSLARILDVFPDIERKFVLDKIRSQHELIQFPDEEIEMHPDSAALVDEILEMDGYPKQVDSEETQDELEGRLGKQIVWSRDHYQKPNYKKDVTALLARHFDHVPTHFINATVLEKGNLFDAYLTIEDIESNYFQGPRPYTRSKRPRVQLEKKYQTLDPQLDPSYYRCLIVELQAGKQEFFRQKIKSDQKQEIADVETANLEQHRLDGLLVQCKCCFDDEVPMNRSVVCTAHEEHPFCYDCVKRLAENQIGMKRYQMQCMDESSCTHNLDNDGIGKAVPIKTFDRLQFNQQQAEIKAANIEGLEQCPLCDFQAICDPVEVDSVFSCQNPDCFKVTCRLCHEISHLPKTCEEVKKDRGISARHRIEEARTKAMIRTCPSCHSAIIKEDGCNKMPCTCGGMLCYACKADLSKLPDPYQHFDRGLSTGTGKKCPLYDSKNIDRHVQETNEAEEKAIQEVKAEDDTVEDSTLRIETGKGKAVDRQGQKTATHGYPAAGHNAAFGRFVGEHRHNIEHNELFQQMIDNAGEGRGHRNRRDPRNNRHVQWLDDLRARLPQRPPVLAGFDPPPRIGQPAELFDNPFGNVDEEHGLFQRIPPINFGYGNIPHVDPRIGLFGPAPQAMNHEVIDGNYMNTAQRIHEARDQLEQRRRGRVERRNTVHNPVPLEVNNPNLLPVRNNNGAVPQLLQPQNPGVNNRTQQHVPNHPFQAHPAPVVDVPMTGTAQNNINVDGGNDVTFREYLRARKEFYDLNQRPPLNLGQNQPPNQAQPPNLNPTAVFGRHNRNQGVPQNLNQLVNPPQAPAQDPRRRRNQYRTQEWIAGQTRVPPLWHNPPEPQNHGNVGGQGPAPPVRRQTMPLDNINNGDGNGYGHGFGDHDFRW